MIITLFYQKRIDINNITCIVTFRIQILHVEVARKITKGHDNALQCFTGFFWACPDANSVGLNYTEAHVLCTPTIPNIPNNHIKQICDSCKATVRTEEKDMLQPGVSLHEGERNWQRGNHDQASF